MVEGGGEEAIGEDGGRGGGITRFRVHITIL